MANRREQWHITKPCSTLALGISRNPKGNLLATCRTLELVEHLGYGADSVQSARNKPHRQFIHETEPGKTI